VEGGVCPLPMGALAVPSGGRSAARRRVGRGSGGPFGDGTWGAAAHAATPRGSSDALESYIFRAADGVPTGPRPSIGRKRCSPSGVQGHSPGVFRCLMVRSPCPCPTSLPESDRGRGKGRFCPVPAAPCVEVRYSAPSPPTPDRPRRRRRAPPGWWRGRPEPRSSLSEPESPTRSPEPVPKPRPT